MFYKVPLAAVLRVDCGEIFEEVSAVVAQARDDGGLTWSGGGK